MKCPNGHDGARLMTPDYGDGRGAEFACYRCDPRDPQGWRFISFSEEARRESESARRLSRENAEKSLGAGATVPRLRRWRKWYRVCRGLGYTRIAAAVRALFHVWP
jgi:hypothetical protein